MWKDKSPTVDFKKKSKALSVIYFELFKSSSSDCAHKYENLQQFLSSLPKIKFTNYLFLKKCCKATSLLIKSLILCVEFSDE